MMTALLRVYLGWYYRPCNTVGLILQFAFAFACVAVKSSQVLNPHKSKSSQSSTGKSSVCMTGFVVLLLRFFGFRMG